MTRVKDYRTGETGARKVLVPKVTAQLHCHFILRHPVRFCVELMSTLVARKARQVYLIVSTEYCRVQQ